MIALAGTALLSDGSVTDGEVIVTNRFGTLQWRRRYGGPDHDLLSAVRPLDGDLLACGATVPDTLGGGPDGWLLRLDEGGNPRWQTTHDRSANDNFSDCVALEDGGFLAVGKSLSGDSFDGWMVRTDESGLALWDKAFGGASDDFFQQVVVLPGAGFAVLGSTGTGNDGMDAWLIRTDRDGNVLWNERYGGAGTQTGTRLAVMPDDDGYVFAGYRSGADQGGWLVRTDGAGATQWETTLNPGFDGLLTGLALPATGGFVVAGKALPGGPLGVWLQRVAATGALTCDPLR